MKSSYVISICIMTLLLSLSMASAMDWDNIKSYNPSTKEVTITNAFGLGSVLAKIKLVDNTDTCFDECSAVMEVNLNQKTQYLLQNMRFVNSKDKNREIKYKTYFMEYEDYYIQVPDYGKEVCGIAQNGSNSCSSPIKGYKNEKHTREKILGEYTGTETDNGKHYLKIIGYKSPQESIDWIPTYFGKEITEWAWWSGVTPLVYWNMNQTGGDANDTSGNGKNATNIKNVPYLPGRLGNALGKTNSTAYLNYSGSGAGSELESGEFTVIAWMNLTGTTQATVNYPLLGSGAVYGAACSGWQLVIRGANSGDQWNKIQFVMRKASDGSAETGVSSNETGNFNNSQWHMFVATRRADGNLSLYADNHIVSSLIYTENISYNSGLAGCNTVGRGIHIGTTVFSGPIDYLNGSLDDIGIYNTAITESQITTFWNNGLGSAQQGATSFAVTLESPDNAYQTTNNSIIFISNYTLISDPIINATYYIYNFSNNAVINKTTVANNVLNLNRTSLQVNNLLLGNYNWNVEACSDAECIWGTNRTFNITSIAIVSSNYNATTYETATEGYSSNISYDTVKYPSATANLIYNGTSYAATKTGTVFSKTLTMNTVTGNKSFYWQINLNASDQSNSTTSWQYVYETRLGPCNSSLKTIYANFTFVDETTNARTNATADQVYYTSYYLGDGSVTKSLLYTNLTSNFENTFCFSPPDRRVDVTLNTFQYSFTGYPQRQYFFSGNYTNSSTNKVLYLLGSGDGIYVTFQTTSSTGSVITGVDVVAQRQIDGVWTTVGQGTTDSSGLVTFWLNPNYDHTITFSKSACTTATQTVRPTQSQYTQSITCEGGASDLSTTYVSTVDGVYILRMPASGIINPGLQNFSYFAHSDRNNLNKILMQIVSANGTSVYATTSTTCSNSTNCYASLMYNATSGSNIKGRYYVDIGDGQGYILVEGDAHWKAIATNVSSTGTLKDFFANLKYTFNVWGDDNYACSVNNNATACESTGNCKWIKDGQYNYCIPLDNVNKTEYSKIVLLFLLMAIALAFFNKFTGVDQSYPGMALFFAGFMIIIGSITGGLSCANQSCQGIFYYDGLFNGNSFAAGFVNNYILAIIVSFIMVGYFFSIQRRYT